jgi:CheY-like chemotaxis protein
MGLGLAIVRRIADLLQHRMELASRPGRGSRFSIGVPLAAAPVAPAPPRSAARSTAPSIAQPTPHDLARRCVVAIDDDPAVLAAMCALIESRGARVLAAGTADGLRESLADLAIDAVDLVVADLRLADGRCGLAEIERVREQAGRSIPALLVSGDTGAEARALAVAAGVRLLAKPVVGAEFEAALAEALGRSGLRPAA